MGITCYMVRPTRASCIGISQQWRASLTDGNSVTPAQVTSFKVKDESLNLTALAERQRIRLKGYRQRSAFWAFQNARCPLLARSRPSVAGVMSVNDPKRTLRCSSR